MSKSMRNTDTLIFLVVEVISGIMFFQLDGDFWTYENGFQNKDIVYLRETWNM